MPKYPTPADIAEMKARGYDRSVTEEAEAQSLRAPLAQTVCRVIEEAFAGVTLGNGVGLQEARGLDDYEDAATRAAYRATDEKEDWRSIPPAMLNAHYSSLSFFDAEGMRFHLPAYLIADLHGDYGCGMDICLTHLSEHSLTQFSLLSAAQRRAVRMYLLHIAEEPDYAFGRPHIIRALDEYWCERGPS